ncbi:MAG: universal stress protein [Sphingopyxis sp.]|nr:universal stress protein [Sphingopyxis sp.]
MRSIVVHADAASGSTQRIETALAIARRHGAHVTAHLNLPLQRFFATDPFGGAYVVTDALALAQADVAARRAELEGELKNEDVPWDVVTTDVDLVTALAGVAALSDLAIVGMQAPGITAHDGYPMLAGDLAMAARVPVLALPERAADFDLNGPALAAWNGSAEAATALRLAVPMLRGRTVTLVRIGATDGHFPDTAALSFLSRHGIAAELRDEARGVETVEDAIERVATDMGAAVIVMGAFGHSRLRQTLFGGVTRFMLESGRFPLLLGH